MKAIKIIDNVIRYTEDTEIPTLTPQFNVLVKVHYAGICRTDIGDDSTLVMPLSHGVWRVAIPPVKHTPGG